MSLPPKVSLALVAAGLLAAVAPRSAAAQQHNITIDRSFGSPTPLTGPNYSIAASLGKQVGSNLFHSFGQFGLSTGESAIFTPPPPGAPPVTNVIGRVTGGAGSSINGSIVSNSITGASLYLINPSGIVFGPNATVNVSGSFHASTADYLKMSDGTKIPTGTPDSSTFSAASPVAFGFLTLPAPRNIAVIGSTLAPGPTPSGSAPANLGLVAGPVAITGGTLRAPAGTIQVTGVAGAGEVPVDPRNTAALTVTRFGPVAIAARSLLTASVLAGPGNGGSVFIRAGNLTIDASTVATNNAGSGPRGQLVLQGDNLVTLSRGTIVQAVALGAGSGAGVTISTAPAGVIEIDASTLTVGSVGSGNGGALSVRTGQLLLSNGGVFVSIAQASGNGSPIAISADSVLLDGGARQNPTTGTGIFSTTSSKAPNAGRGGAISIAAGTLVLHNGANVLADSSAGAGGGGSVAVSVGSLTIDSGASLSTLAAGTGNAGNISVLAAGPVTIDRSVGGSRPSTFVNIGSTDQNTGELHVSVVAGNGPPAFNGIGSVTEGTGNAGNVTVNAGAITITNNGLIVSGTTAAGNTGRVTVASSGLLQIDGTGGDPSFFTGIASQSLPEFKGTSGSSGDITVSAGTLSIVNNGLIAAGTFGSGDGGHIFVGVGGNLTIQRTSGNPAFVTGITSQAFPSSTGNAGSVAVNAGALSIFNNGVISGGTFGFGNGGSVSVNVAGQLGIDGTSQNPAFVTGITSQASSGSTGNAGSTIVNADALSIVNGGMISSRTFGPGNGGSVMVTAAGLLTLRDPGSGIVASATASGNAGSVTVAAPGITIARGGQIASTTAGTGAGGSIEVTTPGVLVLDGAGIANTQIAASATGPQSGPGGSVTVAANSLTVEGGAQIASTTAGPGTGGDIAVTVANGVTLSGASLSGASGITASALPGSRGRAGEVTLMAGGAIALSGGAIATSSTAGAGNGGTVRINAEEPLTLSDPGTGIIASATSTASGNAGSVAVGAPQVTITSGADIASTTAGTGAGGSVTVTTPGALVLDGVGIANTQIAASAIGPQSGPGGSVTIQAGTLTVSGGAQVASTTAGPGKGGDIGVTVANDVTLSGTGPNGASGITASAALGSSGRAGEVVLTTGGAIALSGGAGLTTSTAGTGNGGTVRISAEGPLTLSDPGTEITASATSTASGNAGSVTVGAPKMTIASGAEIASTTAGTGAGGSVDVTTPGALVLNGNGDPNTQIAASATGPQSGPGGSVTVQANTLTVSGAAQIASSTAGPGKGGDVNITVASDIVLPDPGPQITARSTGSGDAGSITLSAMRLLMNNGAAISTEAETSTANGGNITLHVRDFLYLTSSEISASVKGETGNGGNIAIDPQLVILNHSRIIASAVQGRGGNITIDADELIASSDSIFSATGQIVFIGPRIDVNGALVVLSTELRSAAEVLRESCAAQSLRPQSSFVEAGRGGLPQDPEATLPALYIAGRDVNPNPQSLEELTETRGALQTTLRLTMRCG